MNAVPPDILGSSGNRIRGKDKDLPLSQLYYSAVLAYRRPHQYLVSSVLYLF